MDRIRVLIVDDHTVVRQGLRALLHSAPDIEVIGEASDGSEAVEVARKLRPDVILMDVVMPRLDGAGATQQILKELAETKIIALSGAAIDRRIMTTLRAGALGYFSKTSDDTNLLEAIRQVARGRMVMPRRMTQRLLERIEPPGHREPLSQREIEILRLVAKALTNAEIAKRVNISAATVRTHISNILAKLGVSNRVEATLFALRDGITTLEESLDLDS